MAFNMIDFQRFLSIITIVIDCRRFFPDYHIYSTTQKYSALTNWAKTQLGEGFLGQFSEFTATILP